MIEAVLVGLAGWRLASLLVREDGPFLVFDRLRMWAGVPAVGELKPKPFIGGLLTCVWCCSVWTSIASWACWEYVGRPPVVILAAAAVAVLADVVAKGR